MCDRSINGNNKVCKQKGFNMTNIQIKMDNIEIISIEEQRLWTARKKELIKHASIEVKQQYFPKNIIEWDKKGKEI